MAAAAVAVSAGPSSAGTGANIDTWSRVDGCASTGHVYCLWYLTGKGTGGYGWGGNSTTAVNIPDSATFTIPGSCPFTYCGSGAAVRDDAESMSDASSVCHVTVWSANDAQGDWNWLDAGEGGNLTTSSPVLANHDESIGANNC
jgi:hypothetical protein